MQKISHQDLYEHYITNGMPASKIASKFDISLSSVRHALARYGIKKEYDYHEKKSKFNPAFKGVLDKDFLIENIIKQGKSISMVMKEYTLSRNKITGALKKHGVEVPRYLSIKNGERLAILANKELLEKLHYDKKMTKTQIAKKFGSTLLTVTKLFEKFGIKAINYKPRESYILRSKRKKEIQQQKALEKELNRQRIRAKGGNQSERTKLKIQIEAVIRASKSTKRTLAELQVRELLETMRVAPKPQEQKALFILRKTSNEIIGAYCVDFYIGRSKKIRHSIVIQIDSRYHHNLPEIIKKDTYENQLLTDHGEYTVVRLWNDELTQKNLERILEVAYRLDTPKVVRFHYPPEFLKRCPKNYLEKDKEIVCEVPPSVI